MVDLNIKTKIYYFTNYFYNLNIPKKPLNIRVQNRLINFLQIMIK